MRYKAITAIKFNAPDCATDKRFLFDKLKCLGNKLVVANGHTFLQMPGNKTKSNGATGISTFQNSRMPNDGKNIKAVKIKPPISQTVVCIIRQIKIEREESDTPDFKKGLEAAIVLVLMHQRQIKRTDFIKR